MNYEAKLVNTGRAAAQARVLANQAERQRDSAIREASFHGDISARDISGWVGVSHQRVSQIISADPIAPPRPKLHEAMLSVLKGSGTEWVSVHEIARQITERRMYRRKDHAPLPPAQVRARASRYPHLFEGTNDGTNRLRLRATAPAP
jgi:hypothetical protein